MKKWPKDQTLTLSAEDIMKPLMAVYRKVMKNPEKDHKYTGYELGQKERAYTEINDIGTTSFQEYHAERDRDLHYVFLLTAFQLGVEQGRRDERSTASSHVQGIASNLKLIKGRKKVPEDILEFYVKTTEQYVKFLQNDFS